MRFACFTPVVQVVEAHCDLEAPAVELAALLRGQRPIADDSDLVDMAPLESAAPLWKPPPASMQAHQSCCLVTLSRKAAQAHRAYNPQQY